MALKEKCHTLTSPSMVAVATLLQTVLHPGYCFPALSHKYKGQVYDSDAETGEKAPAAVTNKMSFENETPSRNE